MGPRASHPEHPVRNRANSRHRLARLVALICVLGVLASLPGTGWADDLEELEDQREQVQREKAARAAEIDALQAESSDLIAALDTVNAQYDDEAAALRAAQRAADSAQIQLEGTRAELNRIDTQVASLEARVDDRILRSYIGGVPALAGLLNVDNFMEASRRIVLLRNQASTDEDLLSSLGAARQDQTEMQRQLVADEAAAKEKVAASQARLATFSEAQKRQQQLSDDVESRLDRALSEAQALESVDAQLASQIRTEQDAIAARMAFLATSTTTTTTTAPPATTPATAQAAAPSASAATGSGAGNTATAEPQTPTPQTPTPATTAAPPAPANVTISAYSGEIVSVNGIRVHQSIAQNLQALLQAAAADGISMSGGGFRDPQAQIDLRIAHCGSSQYAIYQMPASQCSPPTARPGSSNHERGLAVDFTQGGRALNRSSSGFAWLKANGARFGFQNLPSEPWHWSVDGR